MPPIVFMTKQALHIVDEKRKNTFWCRTKKYSAHHFHPHYLNQSFSYGYKFHQIHVFLLIAIGKHRISLSFLFS